MRFAIDASDPRATNPDPVLLKEVKRARRCFDALVSGRIGSVAERLWRCLDDSRSYGLVTSATC